MEPWKKLPHEVSRLTDWQVLNLYLIPAARQAAELRGEPTTPIGIPKEQQTREAWIAGMTAQFGGDPEEHGRTWDRMQAEIKAAVKAERAAARNKKG